jgi:hypothetical protein
MTEAQWLACRNPIPMLELIRGKVSERKVRLLAVAFLRHLQHLMPEDRCWEVLEAAERYADGSAGLKELKRARKRAEQILSWAESLAANPASSRAPGSLRREVAFAVLHTTGRSRPMTFSFDLLRDPANAPYFATMVRDGIGNPFRPSSPLAGSVLAWNEDTVRRFAEGIYAERAFERLPILADALLDAGCDDEELIAHCRSAGPHVRGCWAVDLILGKS